MPRGGRCVIRRILNAQSGRSAGSRRGLRAVRSPGRTRLAGAAGPEARRGHRRRGARRALGPGRGAQRGRRRGSASSCRGPSSQASRRPSAPEYARRVFRAGRQLAVRRDPDRLRASTRHRPRSPGSAGSAPSTRPSAAATHARRSTSSAAVAGTDRGPPRRPPARESQVRPPTQDLTGYPDAAWFGGKLDPTAATCRSGPRLS